MPWARFVLRLHTLCDFCLKKNKNQATVVKWRPFFFLPGIFDFFLPFQVGGPTHAFVGLRGGMDTVRST